MNKKSYFLFFFQVEVVVIQEISFRKPKQEHFHVHLQDFVVDQQPVHFADTASFLEKLKKANKSAVIRGSSRENLSSEVCEQQRGRLIRVFVISFLESIISKLATSEMSVF